VERPASRRLLAPHVQTQVAMLVALSAVLYVPGWQAVAVRMGADRSLASGNTVSTMHAAAPSAAIECNRSVRVQLPALAALHVPAGQSVQTDDRCGA